MNELELFAALVALGDPVERDALLDRQSAGQPELRQRLEQLLAAHFQSSPLLDATNLDPLHKQARPIMSSPMDVTSDLKASAERAGCVVAQKYKLLQQIGEGGMGTVWMAEQSQPIKRRVAVKLIRVERGQSKSILARFEAERQAIALMDHPHIAKLLDAGSTDSGAPFFVMELVKGIPLTEYCDQHRLSVTDRLTLFAQICGAVQHAHQKGIIHRDLKPTNILIENHDDQPVPKIIDFGLAKATSGLQLTDQSLFTAFGSVMGTPLYMAPEQAKFNAVDVDTRADIYSLGVILYELLTGSTPITRESFKKVALDEMLKLIRDQQAPTPSSRLSTADRTPSVASNRQMEPGKLGRFVKGELDWIVLKALSKERDRRYETANGFARDIERFLSHEPVQAGPPSTAYKFRKFVQRNRGQVIAASLVLLALMAGITGTTWGLLQANRSAELERIALEDANRKREEATQQQIRAELAEKQLLDDYRAATDDAIENLISARSELGPEEKQYLNNSLARWQAYALRQGQEAKNRLIRAEGHYRVALLYTKLNQRTQAESEYLIARDIQKSLVDEFPEEPTYQYDLARTAFSLANILSSLSKPNEQILAMQEALDIQQRLVNEHPAETSYQDFLAKILNNFADILEQKSPEIGLSHVRSALAIRQKLAKQFPDDPKQTEGLMLISLNTGDSLLALNRTTEAWEEYQRSLALAQKLVKDDPTNTLYLARLARVQEKRARVLLQLQKPSEALAEAEDSLDNWQQSVSRSPIWSHNRHGLGLCAVLVGGIRFRLKEFDQALTEFQRAQKIYEVLVELFPTRSEYWWYLDLSHAQIARTNIAMDQPEQAVLEIRNGLRILQLALNQKPNDTSIRRSLAERHSQLGVALSNWGETSESMTAFQASLVQWEFLVGQHSEERHYRLQALYHKAKVGRHEEAVEEIEQLVILAGWTVEQRYTMACVYAIAAQGTSSKREDYALRAMTLLKEAITAGREWLNVDFLQTDKDIDVLRDRDDFRQMLNELNDPSAP